MWKWLTGCAVVVVVVLACGLWWALEKYKTFTATGGAATVTIAASPARVFASLATGDSYPTWQIGVLGPSHRGVLAVGDTLRLAPDSMTATAAGGSYPATATRMTRSAGMSVNGRPTSWIVTEVKPGVALTVEMRDDNGQRMGSQRDSLVASGDSTRIVATTEMPMMDSLAATDRASGRVGHSNLLDAGSKLVVSTLRALHQQELTRLKARIEGRPVPPAHD